MNIIYFLCEWPHLLTDMCALSIGQLLKPWNQIGQCHPHFLYHINFQILLAFYDSNHWKPNSRKICQQRAVLKSNVKTLNYIKLIVWAVSSMYWVSLNFLQLKISNRSPRSLLKCHGASWFRRCSIKHTLFHLILWVVLLSLCYSCGNWGLERLNNGFNDTVLPFNFFHCNYYLYWCEGGGYYFVCFRMNSE